MLLQLLVLTTYLGLLFALLHLPWLFGLLTFALSLILFGRLEYARNIHDLAFYTEQPHPVFRIIMQFWSILEVFIRSVVISLLPLLFLVGNNRERITHIAAIFVACVLLAYLILRGLQYLTKMDILRWGYIRLSILIGILFSVLIAQVKSASLSELAWSTFKQRWGTGLSINETIEMLYSLIDHANIFIATTLASTFGAYIGGLISTILSVNILYGFVIVLYAMLPLYQWEN